MLKSRKMKNIVTNEVSLVDKPANLRPFLLFKQEGKSKVDFLPVEKKKINIEIVSDGTKGGTQVTINGDKIGSMRSFNFSFWEESEAKSKVSCSYSKLIEDDGGFQRTETFYLAKGDNIMDKRIQEALVKIFGDKVTKFEKAELNEETISEIVKALTTIESYKDEFPTDLGAAIGLIAAHAGHGYKAPVEKKDDTKPAQTEHEKKIEDAQKALDLLKSAKPAATDESSELQKTVETLAKSVADLTGKLEKKEASDQLTEIKESLTKVADRLKAVERQPASTKKSLPSDTPVVKQEVQKDSEGREIGNWPSLVGSEEEAE